jgi:hypothetical protein
MALLTNGLWQDWCLVTLICDPTPLERIQKNSCHSFPSWTSRTSKWVSLNSFLSHL